MAGVAVEKEDGEVLDLGLGKLKVDNDWEGCEGVGVEGVGDVGVGDGVDVEGEVEDADGKPKAVVLMEPLDGALPNLLLESVKLDPAGLEPFVGVELELADVKVLAVRAVAKVEKL